MYLLCSNQRRYILKLDNKETKQKLSPNVFLRILLLFFVTSHYVFFTKHVNLKLVDIEKAYIWYYYI